KNVGRALQEGKARKVKTIAFLGRDGGSTIGMADIDLLVKDDSTARIQEAHKFLIHVLCEIIEAGREKKEPQAGRRLQITANFSATVRARDSAAAAHWQ